MKTKALVAFSLVTTTASAHPGHGANGWFHEHQDALVDAAMIAVACIVAALVARLLWKAAAR